MRCQAEQALRGSEERLRLALESGRLGIWDYDLKARTYVEISDQCKYNLGLPQTGTPTRAQLQQMIHPEDLARVKSAMQAVPAMLSDYHEEYRVIWPNGEVHWISARGSTICDASGQPIHVIGTTHDITDRKRVEEQKERDLQVAVMRADQDPLTELLNHRAFQKRLEQEANKAQAQGTNLAVVMLDLDNFKFFNDAYGHTVGDDVLRLVASRLQSLTGPNDTVARFGGDEFALLLPDVGTASRKDIERNVRDGMEDLTYLPEGQMAAIPVGICLGIALYPYENLDWHEIVSRADERLRRAKTSGISENEADQVRTSMLNAIEGFSMLDALVTAVDNKDRYTRRHSEDVLTYSLMIARELGFSETEQQTVAVSALLHDVGKIGIPDAILRKPSSLTDTEYGAIKQHPEMGAIMVASVQGLEDTLDAVRHHHERWDGCGYPGGLKGAETPIMARLMAVADAFSAMTTDRPYRKGMNVHNAFLILNSGAGTQWDAECVQAFVRAHNGETDTEAA